ncbi:MAG TPA: YCF48-related protein [Fluviicola sp.]|nr:YCF48-related protein [Fluviicola sp.]
MKKLVILFLALLTGGMSATAQNWYQIPTGVTNKLNTIDFPSSTVGYIGGNDSLLLKTTDGGQTWNPVAFSGITFYPNGEHFVKLQFITENIGFAAIGPYSGSYKTIDGGLTWTALPLSGNLCFNQGMYFFDENNGMIGGSGCFQGELIDVLVNGIWYATVISDPSPLNSLNMITDIDFRGSLGLASSQGGRFLRTTNGGQTWDSIASPHGNSVPLLSIAIIDDTLCYAGFDHMDGSGFGLLRSHDGGLTWSDETDMATFFYPDYYGIHLAVNDRVYAGAKSYFDQGGLIFTRNNGSWIYESVDHAIYDFSSYGDSIVFGVGDSGYVVTNVPINVLSTDDLTNEIMDFTVSPNPTDGKITFSTAFSENAGYHVFTPEGKSVDAGTLSAQELDMTNFPAGTYIVRIRDHNSVFVARVVRQ